MQRRTQAHSAESQTASSSRSSTADYLHPTLRTALGCMDINLEAELARYRRQRPPRAGVIRRFFLRPGAPLQKEELTAIATGGALLPESGAGETAQGRALMSPEELVAELKQRDQADLAPSLAQQHPQNLQQRLLPAPGAGNAPALAGMADLGDAESSGFADPETAAIAPNLNDLDAETALALQNIKGTAALLNRTRPPEPMDPSETLAIAPVGQLGTQTGTLARSPGSVRQRRQSRSRGRATQFPVSVLGVATIGVMAAGTLWTYITHYPDSDQYLRVGVAWNAIAGALDLPKLGETDDPPATLAQREPVPTGDVNVTPNLIRKELVDLDLRSLSTLGAKSPEPEPTASAQIGAVVPTAPPTTPPTAAPVASPSPGTPATIGSATTDATPTEPNPTQSAGAAAANAGTGAATGAANSTAAGEATSDRPQSPPKVVAIPADGTSYYYVVVATGGEAALTAARKVVPDAYVREFPVGERIQLGALDSLAQAQQLARQIQAAGIRPEIYHPQVQD